MDESYTITRRQLIDAIANIRIEGVRTSGPAEGLAIADDMADAILSQLRPLTAMTTCPALYEPVERPQRTHYCGEPAGHPLPHVCPICRRTWECTGGPVATEGSRP